MKREKEREILVVLEGSVENNKMQRERERKKERKEGTRRYCVSYV